MEDLEISNIKKRSVQGIVSLISRQFILKLISFATALVIYTNLSAAESGTYIIIMTIQQIISFFTDFGLGAALVHKKEDIEKDEIRTVFTIQFIVTAVILTILVGLRGSLHDIVFLLTKSQVTESGIWLLLSLAFTFFLSSFKIIPSILLERKIHFQKLVIPQIAESLVFNIILVILVLQGLGLSSYSWAFAVSGIVGVPLYYMVSPWPISFGISRKAMHHLKFGAQFQAKNILANIKDKFMKLFLGADFGSTKIGYIGFAETWAFYAYSFIVDSITKVSFATFSRLQEEKSHVKQTLERSLFFVSALMFPINVGLMLTMPYFIEYIPKWHKWEPAIISLIFLTMNATVSSLSGILLNVLDANGKVKVTLRLMGIWTVLTWVLTIALIRIYDFNGYAIASFLVTLTIAYTIHLVKQVVQFNFFASIYKPLIATVIMGLSVYGMTQLLVKDILTLIVVIIISAAIYSLSIYLLAGKQIIIDIRSLFSKT